MSLKQKNNIKKLLLYSSLPIASISSLLAISCKKPSSSNSEIRNKNLLTAKLDNRLKVLEEIWDTYSSDIENKTNISSRYKTLRSLAFDAIRSDKLEEISAAITQINDFLKEIFGNSKNKIAIEEYQKNIDLYWDSYERFIDLMQNQYISDAYSKIKDKYRKESLEYENKNYNIYLDIPKLSNILTKKELAVYSKMLKDKVDAFEKELSSIIDDSLHNNAPKLDEKVPEERHIDWHYDVIPKLKELVIKTWDKETYKKIKTGQTYGEVIKTLGEDLSKRFDEIPKEYVKYWDFIDVDFLKNEVLQLQDKKPSDKVNLLKDKKFNVRVFNSKIINLDFSRIDNVEEVINHLFKTYILPEITTYHWKLVIFNKLKKIIKEYEETYTSLKNIALKQLDNFYLNKLSVLVKNKEIELTYSKSKEGVDKPTRFRENDGRIYTTTAKDLNNLPGSENIEEILEIGYYREPGPSGIIRAPRMPKHIKKVPQLPEVVNSLEAMFVGLSKAVINGIENWDTSNVTTMKDMFTWATSFNQDILAWNVENVRDMSGMFRGASSFNKDLYTWNVENVETMKEMFERATSFNRSLYYWNPTSLKNMNYMFYGASSFNQNLSSWHLRKDVENYRFNWYTNDWREDRWPKFNRK